MSKKKLIAVAIVLMLVMFIGRMLAYFTDTDTVTNVFTLGDNVEISLSETGWTLASGTTYTNTNANGIHPGAVVAKAPVITNDSTTTSAYVFAEIIVPCYATTGTTANAPLFTFTANSEWALINIPAVDATSKTITYVYAYGTDSDMTELEKTDSTTAVFNSVTLESTLTSAQKATANAVTNIVVNAYGIQIDGLGTTDPAEIFALFGN